MATEIEEIVDDTIEDIGMEAVMEPKSETADDRPSWETWVALISSLLAVVSAIAALLATFKSDEAATAEANENYYAVVRQGVEARHDLLQVKVDILAALDKDALPETLQELSVIREKLGVLNAKVESHENEADKSYESHDHLAIAVTFFQLTILLGGLSVLVKRKRVWLFGLLFTAGGLGFFGYGLLGV